MNQWRVLQNSTATLLTVNTKKMVANLTDSTEDSFLREAESVSADQEICRPNVHSRSHISD